MQSPLLICSHRTQATSTPPRAGRIAGCLRHPTWLAAADTDIRIEPAWKVSIVYGMPAIYHQPAAYYFAARFQDDFESAVLHAVNGGGQNQARAILTGACRCPDRFSGIPQRFLDGLADLDTLKSLAIAIASQVDSTADTID